jgi:hypothetical protein
VRVRTSYKNKVQSFPTKVLDIKTQVFKKLILKAESTLDVPSFNGRKGNQNINHNLNMTNEIFNMKLCQVSNTITESSYM